MLVINDFITGDRNEFGLLHFVFFTHKADALGHRSCHAFSTQFESRRDGIAQPGTEVPGVDP